MELKLLQVPAIEQTTSCRPNRIGLLRTQAQGNRSCSDNAGDLNDPMRFGRQEVVRSIAGTRKSLSFKYGLPQASVQRAVVGFLLLSAIGATGAGTLGGTSITSACPVGSEYSNSFVSSVFSVCSLDIRNTVYTANHCPLLFSCRFQ